MKRFNAKPVVVACALALASAGAHAASDPGTDGMAHERGQGSDLWKEAQITTTYTLNEHLNLFDIDVEVSGNTATLSGTVESLVERDLAAEIAMGVDGITDVNNQLTVEPRGYSKSGGQAGGTAEQDGDTGFMRVVYDANITAKVKSQLLWNDHTDGLNINVDTEKGRVTLSGTVAGDAESDLAAQIARNTKGVRDVENRLSVRGEEMATSEMAAAEMRDVEDADEAIVSEARQARGEMSDGWITTKVKSSLMYNSQVDGTDINVETSDGVVHLEGIVGSRDERSRAIEVARSIKGVKDVKDDLKISGES